jgi:hypothetical protein
MGAAAGWQPGESSIANFENSFGQVFHGDTGRIDEAQKELSAAHVCFSEAGSTHGAMADLFWVDPWSRQGQDTSARLLPVGHEIRPADETACQSRARPLVYPWSALCRYQKTTFCDPFSAHFAQPPHEFFEN